MPGSCFLIHPCNDTKTEPNLKKKIRVFQFTTVHEQERAQSKTCIVERIKDTLYLSIPLRNNRRFSSSQRAVSSRRTPTEREITVSFVEDSHRLRVCRFPSSTRYTHRGVDKSHRQGEKSPFSSPSEMNRREKEKKERNKIDSTVPLANTMVTRRS